jgi:hypothetical protein
MRQLKGVLKKTAEPPGRPLTIRSPQNERPRSLRVLVVEDNIINQRLAVRMVEKQGHSAAVAGTGNEALEALEKEKFDLVLLVRGTFEIGVIMGRTYLPCSDSPQVGLDRESARTVLMKVQIRQQIRCF